MEVDAPLVAIPLSAAGSGGDVTAPSGNIYLDPDDMQGVDEADRTDDLPPEEQHHDGQDVEMGHVSTAEDQMDDAPPTATFRRDPNLPRGEARQMLLKEINQSHEGGQFYVDVMPPTNARDKRALHHICEKEIYVCLLYTSPSPRD